jgi:hypothetical protein
MLTPEQLQAAADEAKALKEAQTADLNARIDYEAQRDKLAWQFIQANRSLSLADAKAKADAQLGGTSPLPQTPSEPATPVVASESEGNSQESEVNAQHSES